MTNEEHLRARCRESRWTNGLLEADWLAMHWAMGQIEYLREELDKYEQRELHGDTLKEYGQAQPKPTKRKFVSIGGPELCAVDDRGDAWIFDDSGGLETA